MSERTALDDLLACETIPDALREAARRELGALRLEQSELLASRARYHSLVELMSEGMALIDSDLHVVYANRALGGMLGHTPDALLRWSVRDLLTAAGRETFAEVLERDYRSPASTGDLEWSSRTGDRVLTSLATVPIREAGGAFCGALLVMSDVTEVRRREEELRESGALFRAIFENASVGIFLLSEDDRYLRVNERWAEMLGYTVDELLAVKPSTLTHPEDYERSAEWGGALQSRQVPDYRMRKRYVCKDGRTLWVDLCVSTIEASGSAGPVALGVAVDVTERKDAEERQAVVSAGLRRIVSITDELLATPDMDTLLRRAVELPRERLGVERCGLHLLDGSILRGTYGTGRHGETVDEHHIAFEDPTLVDRLTPHGDDGALWAVDHAQRFVYGDGPHLPDGWIATTALRGMAGPVGYLFNDAGITSAPYDEARQELLAVYCASLANIIEARRAEQRRLERLERVQRQQAAIVELATDQAARGDLTQAARAVTEVMARTLRVDRVGVWLLTDDGERLEPVDFYDAAVDEHSIGDSLTASDHAPYMAAMRSERAVAVSDVRTDALTATLLGPYLEPGGVGAVLDAPIRLSGDVVGIVCHEHLGGPREWQEHEIAFAAEMSDQVAQVILAAQRLEAERALRRSEREMATVLDSMVDHVVYLDPDLRVIWANRGAAADAGLTPEQCVGRHCRELWAECRQEEHTAVSAALHANDLRTGEVFVDDGRVIAVRACPVRDEHGSVVGVVQMAHDTTAEHRAEQHRRDLEAHIERGQRLESLGVLAGGIAHDFNNILGGITGFTELTLRLVPEGGKAEQNLKRIMDASMRAKGLVQQILAFSRQGSQRLEPTDLEPIVREALAFLRSSLPSTIAIRHDVERMCVPVLADATAMHQVILNLCTNAHHAMAESGGVLGIALSPVVVAETDTDPPGGLASGDYVRLSVSDTGCGIAPSIRERIFEPFFTTKGPGQGTGLGLATTHGIVTSHGGAVTFESTVGEGTTFHVFLPRIECDAHRSGHEDNAPPRGSGERVLFVDDEEYLVSAAAESLTSLGYEVHAVSGGPDALAAFRAAPDAYDVIVSDVTMPELTGLDLLRAIRLTDPGAKVVLATGFSHHVGPDTAEAAGASAFLMKPYGMTELARALRKALDGPAP